MVSKSLRFAPILSSPYPPVELHEAQLDELLEELDADTPTESMIYDLRDWDVQFRDALSEDWYFAAVFGPQSSSEDSAKTLSDFFLEELERLGIDYDQHADYESFHQLVQTEAVAFVRKWRDRVADRVSGMTPME